jgi:translation initiation factor 1 (eIF-1/SUI1)
MGASTSEPLSQPVIRGHIYDYIASKSLIDARNQAQVRLEDPILVHALYLKAPLSSIPACLTRQEIIDRLLNTSCVEYHRSSRLTPSRASQVQVINQKGKTDKVKEVDMILEAKEEGEFIGVISKGAAKPVQVEIKTRQGRKAVSLITGLETYGIDPHECAQYLMKLGASASGEWGEVE